MDVIWPFVVVLCLALLLVFSYIFMKGWNNNIPAGKSSRVLFVTCHPDDECMFFSPSITWFRNRKCEVFLLCICDGNYYRLGGVRRQELVQSCGRLGILPSNVIIGNNERLEDGPHFWNIQDIHSIVKDAVSRCQADLIVTFDDYGVSGHLNHQSVGLALRWTKSSIDIPVFQLESISIFRKYLSVFDLLFESLVFCYSRSNKRFFLTAESWADFSKGINAMKAHDSQLLWFRYLYIAFSRYMMMNTLVQVEQFPLVR